MSLSQRNISALQKAGQAVHSAAEAIAATVRTQAQTLVANVASNPFGVESEQAYMQFRVLARLSQELNAMEQQLQGLFATATELARPEADVVIAMPSYSAKPDSTQPVEDVVAKPAKAIKAPRVAKPAKPAPARKAPRNAPRKFAKPATAA